ncbi:MAG: hypothetical protein PHC89_02450 [Candidatus Pacebacteria bacterium]|nr:hypothetical protein [Candidatus Paceibacterota bacterium]
MSIENPFDHIRKKNLEKETKRNEEQEALKQQEALEQKNTDDLYQQKEQDKETTADSIEFLAKQIHKITGTQEEMIAQYRKAIKEARKDPETLQYVRDNFDEIFKAGKEQWRVVGSEKQANIEQLHRSEEDLDRLKNEINELYPETSTGKAEQRRKEREENLKASVKQILEEEQSKEEFEEKLFEVEEIAKKISFELDSFLLEIKEILNSHEDLKKAIQWYGGGHSTLGGIKIGFLENYEIDAFSGGEAFLNEIRAVIRANKNNYSKVLLPSMEYVYDEFKERTSLIKKALKDFSGDENQARDLIEYLHTNLVLPILNLKKGSESWRFYPILEK